MAYGKEKKLTSYESFLSDKNLMRVAGNHPDQSSSYVTHVIGLQVILAKDYLMTLSALSVALMIMNYLVSLLCQTNSLHLIMILNEE
jgi:hypothetical protein